MQKIILFLCLLFLSVLTNAQIERDSALNKTQGIPKITPQPEKEDLSPKKHSPKKATILSLILPGAGQVYNRKNWWWKVPLIYGGGGALLYSAIYYQNGYDEFRAAYKQRLETGTNTDAKYLRWQTPTLQVIRDSYRDARDMSYVYLTLVYVVQVLDAAVEAHFYDFNMTENLSWNIRPDVRFSGGEWSKGFSLNYKF
ncbi:MAG: DUF5683 domain-containing protein [Bacteroidia bacterium]